MYRNGSNTHCLPENFINVVVDIDLFFIAWVRTHKYHRSNKQPLS